MVTGASLGLGAAIALKPGACGANTAVNYPKDQSGAEGVDSRIAAAGGTAAIAPARPAASGLTIWTARSKSISVPSISW